MTTYWISDVCSLFNSMNLNPFTSGDKNEKFNSLTRLIIIITLVSSLLFGSMSTEIIVAGLVSITSSVVIYLLTYNSRPPEKSTLNDTVQNRIDGYVYAEESLKDATKSLEVGETPVGKKIIKDRNQNTRNVVSLDYAEKDTSVMKDAYFLNPVKSKNINNISEADNTRKGTVISYAKRIQQGTLKHFDSLLGKNLEMSNILATAASGIGSPK